MLAGVLNSVVCRHQEESDGEDHHTLAGPSTQATPRPNPYPNLHIPMLLRQGFNIFDLNGNGTIDEFEFFLVLRGFGNGTVRGKGSVLRGFSRWHVLGAWLSGVGSRCR